MHRPLLLAGAVAAAVLLSGCAGASDSTVVTVSAAASLSDAFTDIGTAFEAENPGTEVRFNFAGSSTLAEQITAGAPVDVFAAASASTMQTVVDAGLTWDDPIVFASNALAIAVPASNPAGITSLEDLDDPAVSVVACAESVPCGAAAAALFAANDLSVTPVSLEPDVRAVLTKVIADEVDAGIVYRTDLNAEAADGTVEAVAVPEDLNVSTTYPIAVIRPAGQAFVDFVLSPQGQQILSAWGFSS